MSLRRILIVDDDVSVAEGLRDGLQKLPDCTATIATGGQEALRLLRQQTFDLLITDYKMPGTNGLILARVVRRLHPYTTVIMITSFVNDVLYQQASRAAIQRILEKPVKLTEIRSAALAALTVPGG